MRKKERITYESLQYDVELLSKHTNTIWRLEKSCGMPFVECKDHRISAKRKKELKDRIHDFLSGYLYANKGNQPNRGMYL